MKDYKLEATVRRTTTDKVALVVKAENFAVAKAKALAALDTYPNAHDEDGIPYCRTYERQIDNSEVLKLDEQ